MKDSQKTGDTSKRPTLPLGPFELHARIARGGMGEIWRGFHIEQGIPVAVKVITTAKAARKRMRVQRSIF